jgi:hypothetical protein
LQNESINLALANGGTSTFALSLRELFAACGIRNRSLNAGAENKYKIEVTFM